MADVKPTETHAEIVSSVETRDSKVNANSSSSVDEQTVTMRVAPSSPGSSSFSSSASSSSSSSSSSASSRTRVPASRPDRSSAKTEAKDSSAPTETTSPNTRSSRNPISRESTSTKRTTSPETTSPEQKSHQQRPVGRTTSPDTTSTTSKRGTSSEEKPHQQRLVGRGTSPEEKSSGRSTGRAPIRKGASEGTRLESPVRTGRAALGEESSTGRGRAAATSKSPRRKPSVARKSQPDLAKLLAEYKGASDTEKEEIKKEMGYDDLWEFGRKQGLIKNKREDAQAHYHIIHKKTLIDHLVKNLKTKDAAQAEDDFEELIVSFSSRKKGTSKKGTAKKGTTKKPFHRKGTNKKGGDKRGKNQKYRKEREEHKEVSSPLMDLWKKGLECALIDPADQFHRGIPTFITPSELEGLIEEHEYLHSRDTDEDDKKKEDLVEEWKRDLDDFNATIPLVARYFKVFKGYQKVWEEAKKAGIIPSRFECKVEYSEWLPPKDLVAYTQSLNVLPESAVGIVSKPMKDDVDARLQTAEDTLKYREELSKMGLEELVALSVKESLTESENPYRTCRTCVKHLVKEDIISALSSWKHLSKNEGMRRYLRWHAHRKCLHSLKCGSK
jgi:hypothetical protein